MNNVLSDKSISSVNAVKRLSIAVIDAVFPEKCTLCESDISISDNGVCAGCRGNLEVCSGKDSALPEDRSLYYDGHCYPFEYSPEILTLIYAYKNGGRLSLSRFFSSSSFDLDIIRDIDIITYVPSSAAKHRKRGFCHTAQMSHQLSLLCNIPCRSLLIEKKGTQQKKQHFDGRFLNTIGSFVYKSGKLNGERLLLVDDILTTGATVNECSRILKKNGASFVLSLTISRVPFR